MDRMTRKKAPAPAPSKSRRPSKRPQPTGPQAPRFDTSAATASQGPEAGAPDPYYTPTSLEEAIVLLRDAQEGYERMRHHLRHVDTSNERRYQECQMLRRAARNPAQVRTVQRLVTYRGTPSQVEALLEQSLNIHQQYELQGVVVTLAEVSDERRNITAGQTLADVAGASGVRPGNAVSGRYTGPSNITERERP
jgi:hypothetical protein